MKPHGTVRRYYLGCHCSECRKANTEYKRQRSGSHPQVKGPIVAHGTPTRYSKWGCRCAKCRKANAVHVAEWRARKRAA